jgi:hypothetical protein
MGGEISRSLLRGGIIMSRRPAVNPNVYEIADRVKHGFATVAQLLAAMQYRLGELAGTGQLDPDESMRLQKNLFDIYEEVYFGTLCAVRDPDSDDSTWGEDENTYTDGRKAKIQIRVEPEEYSDFNWEHNRFTLGDGAINEHPLGTICNISPVNPKDDD